MTVRNDIDRETCGCLNRNDVRARPKCTCLLMSDRHKVMTRRLNLENSLRPNGRWFLTRIGSEVFANAAETTEDFDEWTNTRCTDNNRQCVNTG